MQQLDVTRYYYETTEIIDVVYRSLIFLLQACITGRLEQNMIGLLLKDLFNLKNYIKQIGLAVILFGLLAVYLKNTNYLIGMMAMMSGMMVITSMSYDEYAKWDKFVLTMPILKKDIVLSKFILLLVTVAFGTAVSVSMAFIMSVLMNLKTNAILLPSGIVALVALLFFCILIPILFKYGVEKARIIMFAIFIIPVLAAKGAVKLMGMLHIPKPDTQQLKMMGYAFPFIVLAVLFLSYHISVLIYNKKEL